MTAHPHAGLRAVHVHKPVRRQDLVAGDSFGARAAATAPDAGASRRRARYGESPAGAAGRRACASCSSKTTR